MKTLADLFEHFLRDVYYAESRIANELPKMAEKANSDQLRSAFSEHLEETKQHVKNLDSAFGALGMKPQGVTCEAMDGILTEAQEVMRETEDPFALDAAMIGAAQSVEHYEITRYGTLVRWAQHLGHGEVADLLNRNLQQEHAADRKLSQLADNNLNQKAA